MEYRYNIAQTRALFKTPLWDPLAQALRQLSRTLLWLILLSPPSAELFETIENSQPVVTEVWTASKFSVISGYTTFICVTNGITSPFVSFQKHWWCRNQLAQWPLRPHPVLHALATEPESPSSQFAEHPGHPFYNRKWWCTDIDAAMDSQPRFTGSQTSLLLAKQCGPSRHYMGRKSNLLQETYIVIDRAVK